MNQVPQLRLAVSQRKPPHRLHHDDGSDLACIELKSHGRFHSLDEKTVSVKGFVGAEEERKLARLKPGKKNPKFVARQPEET